MLSSGCPMHLQPELMHGRSLTSRRVCLSHGLNVGLNEGTSRSCAMLSMAWACTCCTSDLTSHHDGTVIQRDQFLPERDIAVESVDSRHPHERMPQSPGVAWKLVQVRANTGSFRYRLKSQAYAIALQMKQG